MSHFAIKPLIDGPEIRGALGELLIETVANGGSVPGADDATGVNFTDTIDANTTLVGGSLTSSPVATNDTFPVTVVGNISINSANLAVPFSVIGCLASNSVENAWCAEAADVTTRAAAPSRAPSQKTRRLARGDPNTAKTI